MAVAVITTGGFNKIVAGAVTISNFQVGSDNLSGDTNAQLIALTGVSTHVYTGISGQLTYNIDANNANLIHYYVTLDENTGPFTVGNIGLFCSDGTLFAIMALASTRSKQVTAGGVLGDREVYQLDVEYTNLVAISSFVIDINLYATLPIVPTENSLPPPATSPYNAYLIEQITICGNRAGIGVLSNVNTTWHIIPGGRVTVTPEISINQTQGDARYPQLTPTATGVLAQQSRTNYELNAVFGASAIDGFACTPITNTLMVLLGPGSLYQQEQNNPPSDTTIVTMEGVFTGNSYTFGVPATAGQSINYLIQATVVPVTPGNYFVNNTVTVGTKPGTAATTGTQTTPLPDTGYVALYVVTIAYGQTAIVQGNIVVPKNAPFLDAKLPQLHAPVSNSITKVVGPNIGADFVNLIDAFAWLSLRRISSTGYVSFSLQASQQIYSGTGQSVVFAHPDGLRVTITGQNVASPPSNTSFSLSGNDPTSRANDAAANLAMCRSKFPTELRFINGSTFDVRGNINGITSLLITSDGTAYGDGITCRFGFCPLTMIAVTGFSGNGITMIVGEGSLNYIFSFGNTSNGIAIENYALSLLGYTVGYGNGNAGVFVSSGANVNPAYGNSYSTSGNASDGTTCTNNAFITVTTGAQANSNGGNGFGAYFGGKIYAIDTSAASNADSGYYAVYDSFIICTSTSGSSNVQYGYYANYKSQVIATSGSANGNIGQYTPTANVIGNSNSLVAV